MPSGSSFTTSGLAKLGDGLSKMGSLVAPKALTSDGDGSSNTGRASGADLISKSLANTSDINGLGGKVDLLA